MDFQYTVDPGAEVPVMLLTEDIGVDDAGHGIDGNKFLAELLALEALKPKAIEVWINSAGGVVAEGYSIYSAIIDSKVPVDTKCVGMAASISAVIFEAGRNRIMNDYSWLMFHNPYGGDDKKLLSIMKGSISKMIARSGKSEEEILDMMKRTTYIYADEAKEMGLADQVDASDQKNKRRLSQITAARDFHREVNIVLNKLFDKQPRHMSNKLITNKLGLNAEASEERILQAIESIEKKAEDDKTGLEGEIAALEKKLAEAKDKYDKTCASLSAEVDRLKKERDDMDDEVDRMKKERDKAEAEAKEEKARNLVEGYARVGRIKDEKKVKDFWTAQFLADEAIAKEQVEALPLNRNAPVINRIEPALKITAAGVMARLNKEYQEKQKSTTN